MRFDWQTEEDDWEKERHASEKNSAVSKTQIPILWIALTAVLLIFVGGWYLSQLAEGHVDNTTNDLSSEVLAAYNLLNQSVLENDFELFESFLSDRNTYSRQLPLELFRNHYFLDRPFLNLYAQDIKPEKPPQVTFSPDLTRAEIQTLQAYTSKNDPSADPIWLERLTMFRKDNDHWQLTRWPIDEEFWGESLEERIGLLRAEFPTRDEEIGRRLAHDISALLDDICADPSINCPPNFQLKLLLVPYGQNLLDMNDNYRTVPLSSGYDAYRVFLPAPTLVGRPVDEAGYQTLYQGFASWVAAVLVQHYSRTRPVTHEVTADFLTHRQLSPPPTPVLPGQLVEHVETPPIPFPDQEIHLICQGYSPPAWLSYDPAADTWQTIPAPDNAPVLAQLLQRAGERSRFPPEGQGSLIRRPFTIAGGQFWRSYLWLGGLTNMLETVENPTLFLAGSNHQQPDSSHLLFYPFDGLGNPYLANAAACLQGYCRPEPLAGIPVWSPSGRATLLAHQRDDGTPQLYLGDDQGRPFQYLTNGYSPHWLDEETFYYVNVDGNSISEGNLGTGETPIETETVIDIFDLFSPQYLTDSPQNPTITYLAIHPKQSDILVITASNEAYQMENLFIIKNGATPERMAWLSYSDYRFSLPLHFTEDGRYLTIPAFTSGSLSGDWTLIVYDFNPLFQPGEFWHFNTGTAYFDWSDDSKWLLIAEEDALHLKTPRNEYEREIPHNLGCHTIGWSK